MQNERSSYRYNFNSVTKEKRICKWLIRAQCVILKPMIGSISGTVTRKNAGTLIVNVQGVGYAIRVLRDVSLKTNIGESVELVTHLAVREDSLDLYGFKNHEELELFEKLLTVSGIGPKSALAILNLAPVSKLTGAISAGDASYLTKVSGIGKKSAAKIILELKDAVSRGDEAMSDNELRDEKDALEALVSLGYSAALARETLAKTKNKTAPTGERVKEALKFLSRS